MNTYVFQIYPEPGILTSGRTGRLISKLLNKDDPLSYLTEEGYTFYKYKFEEIYKEGNPPVRINQTTMLEEYIDNTSGEEIWEENAWPSKDFFDETHKDPTLQADYPYSFALEFENDEQAKLWFEVNY